MNELQLQMRTVLGSRISSYNLTGFSGCITMVGYAVNSACSDTCYLLEINSYEIADR